MRGVQRQVDRVVGHDRGAGHAGAAARHADREVALARVGRAGPGPVVAKVLRDRIVDKDELVAGQLRAPRAPNRGRPVKPRRLGQVPVDIAEGAIVVAAKVRLDRKGRVGEEVGRLNVVAAHVVIIYRRHALVVGNEGVAADHVEELARARRAAGLHVINIWQPVPRVENAMVARFAAELRGRARAGGA